MHSTVTASSSTARPNGLRSHAEHRISRIASLLRIATWLLIVFVFVIMVSIVAWLIWQPTAAGSSDFLSGITLDEGRVHFELDNSVGVTTGTKFFVSFLFISYAVFHLYCVTRLHFLFGNFKRNKIFATDNVKLLRSLGYALIIGIFIHWLVFSGLAIYAESLEKVLQSIKFTYDGSFIKSAVVVGMAFLSAWVLDIGRELYTEAEYTI